MSDIKQRLEKYREKLALKDFENNDYFEFKAGTDAIIPLLIKAYEALEMYSSLGSSFNLAIETTKAIDEVIKQ